MLATARQSYPFPSGLYLIEERSLGPSNGPNTQSSFSWRHFRGRRIQESFTVIVIFGQILTFQEAIWFCYSELACHESVTPNVPDEVSQTFR